MGGGGVKSALLPRRRGKFLIRVARRDDAHEKEQPQRALSALTPPDLSSGLPLARRVAAPRVGNGPRARARPPSILLISRAPPPRRLDCEIGARAAPLRPRAPATQWS